VRLDIAIYEHSAQQKSTEKQITKLMMKKVMSKREYVQHLHGRHLLIYKIRGLEVSSTIRDASVEIMFFSAWCKETTYIFDKGVFHLSVKYDAL
jgi:hypothetical protein